MDKYRVVLEGRNYFLNLDPGARKYGFVATRYVEADNPDDAELDAMRVVREDAALSAMVRNAGSDPPLLHVAELDVLDSFRGVDPPGADYSFYAEENTPEEKGPWASESRTGGDAEAQ